MSQAGPGTSEDASENATSGCSEPTVSSGCSGSPAPSAFSVFSRDCPSRATLEHVTGRWGGLALTALAEDTLRFNELRRRVDGVSEKMLAQTLHALERDGLVVRHARPVNPPHVDYRLSPLGLETARRLLALVALVEGRMPEVLAARERYDAERGTG